MLFTSASFLFYFFPAFLLAYYGLPWKNAVIVAGSLFFYAWAEPRFVPLLLFLSALNYGLGRAISSSARRRRSLLVAGIALNLSFLLYYKYAVFFAESLIRVLVRLGVPAAVRVPPAALPLGISFFTFQGLSYLIDVYWGRAAAQRNFIKFAAYKLMFAQLIAGPIVRYRDVAAEIEDRAITNAGVYSGISLFVVGLCQKVLIANAVAVPADQIFSVEPSRLSAPYAWCGLACYTIQIFYDVAGYSNMAIGIGRMLGLTYPANFNRPYSATSIADFWRRWHMSLSSWFRDYVFFPLELAHRGGRFPFARRTVNVFIVFLLIGLWHGAAWTFVAFGAWHAALLTLERLGAGKLLSRLPRSAAQAYTLVMVMVGFVFFRAADLSYAVGFLGALVRRPAESPFSAPLQRFVSDGFGGLLALPFTITNDAWLALIAGFVFAVWRVEHDPSSRRAPGGGLLRAARPLVVNLALIAGFVLSVASIAAGTYQPFIYFRY